LLKLAHNSVNRSFSPGFLIQICLFRTHPHTHTQGKYFLLHLDTLLLFLDIRTPRYPAFELALADPWVLKICPCVEPPYCHSIAPKCLNQFS
jgi:hypothetical protein